MAQILIHHQTRGGKLKVDDLRRLLNGAYTGKEQIGDYSLDKGISSRTSKVYVNNKTQKAVVAHRGTSGLSDWFNNLAYGIGGKTLYEMTPRYKEAKKVQDQAMKKYGASNISTIGHSQGGLQAELLGAPTHEIITLNKATRPFSNTKALNEYDVRTQNDIVSALNPADAPTERDITIPSKSRNPIEEHSTDTLKRLNPDMEIGKGLKFNSFFTRGTRGGGLPDLFPDEFMNNFSKLASYLPPEIQGGLGNITGGLKDIGNSMKSALFSSLVEGLI